MPAIILKVNSLNLETERLILEKISVKYTERLFKVFGDPLVMRYWIGGEDKNSGQTRQRLADMESHWETHGFGDWVVISKTDSKVIGFSGLHYIEDMSEVNIGYAFSQSVWRQGFAYEACKEVIKFGFNHLQLAQIVAVIWPVNQVSINLAKKCGLSHWKDIIWSGSDRVVYSINNNQ